jgi:hypothetical protein
MKLEILTLVLIFPFVHLLASKQDVETSALRQIIQNFYSKHFEVFDFIVFGSEQWKLLDIVKNAAKDAEISYGIINLKDNEEKVKINRSAILLFDELLSYHNLHARAVLGNEFPRDFHFIVFIKDSFEIEDVVTTHDTQNPMRATIFSHASFISMGLKIRLTTFEVFQQPNCRQWNPIEVNQFSSVDNKWQTNRFFLEKFQTFNGCPLVVRAFYPQARILNATFDAKGVLERVTGCGAIFNEIISHKLNYTSIYNPFKNNTYYNTSLVIDYEIMGYTIRRLKSRNFRHVTTERYSTVDDIILISKTLPYSQFEKIFMPFDEHIWRWLTITFAIGITVIFIISFTSRSIQNFVFGLRVQAPLLNMM